MEEFSSNLDDGELWLPSDIFFPVGEVSSKFSPQYDYSSERSYMGDLARSFAAYALQHNGTQTFLQPRLCSEGLQRLRPAFRRGSTGSAPTGCLGFNGIDVGHGSNEYGTRGVCTASRPVCHYQGLHPVQRQLQSAVCDCIMGPPGVESLMETRARVLARKQSMLLQNRFLPFRGNGMAGGGREYGGTGVFLPRTATNKTTTPTASTSDPRKRQSVRNRQENQIFQQSNFMKRVDARKQECHYKIPPEMGLPQDWTY